MNQYETMVEALGDLRKSGTVFNFKIEKNGFRCVETGEIFQPEDLLIVDYHRFEGESNPDDMAVLYVVETNTGLLGTLVDAYGTYSEAENSDLFSKLKLREGL